MSVKVFKKKTPEGMHKYVIVTDAIKFWVQLFKNNNVVKISNVNISNKPIFLLQKCEMLLHLNAKASLIFSTKNFSVFGYKVIKHLMS